jgi:uncharacterized protein (TIGR03118 family)
MTPSLPSKFVITTAIALGALCAGARLAEAATYIQTDLVSDISGLAELTDSNLENPWGVSHLTGSPFWVSNQVTNTATLYTVTFTTAVKVPLTVGIPTISPPQGPTGQVANSGSGFDVTGTGKSALFIFANLNGTISAWNGSAGTTAVTEATTPGASYTGLAINQADTMLYAANGTAGRVDVFNSSFALQPSSGFVDPNAIAGYVPFNVQDIGGKVYVTYAPAGHSAQAGATAGTGYVDAYNEDGTFLQRLVTGGNLAAPWGVALAPMSFGKLGGDLLVGNFSYNDSGINAFNPTTGMFEGMIPIGVGLGNTPGGLWDLTFGGGGKDGSPNVLYFTDGINSERDGLFGAITSVPEPPTWAMMLAGFGGLALLVARRRRLALAIGKRLLGTLRTASERDVPTRSNMPHGSRWRSLGPNPGL